MKRDPTVQLCRLCLLVELDTEECNINEKRPKPVGAINSTES